MSDGVVQSYRRPATWVWMVLLTVATLLGPSCLLTGLAGAQELGALRGTVRESGSESALEGAKVMVVGTDLSTTTDGDGRFFLSSVPPGTVHVRVELDGYARVLEAVDIAFAGETRVEFELLSMGEALSGLGIAGRVDVQRSKVGHEPGVYYPDVQPGETLADVLNRVPGVEVRPGGAQLGSPMRIRLRGVKSMTVSADPLVFLDGIQIQSVPADPALREVLAPDPLSIIDPMTIYSIQVLRGPAEAGRYGLGSVAGVILITTKRGG